MPKDVKRQGTGSLPFDSYLDPNFAGGYCGLATAHTHSAVTFATLDLVETLRSAEALARRAEGPATEV
jgi:hypothetical protein